MDRRWIGPRAGNESRNVNVPDFFRAAIAIRHDWAVRRHRDRRRATFTDAHVNGRFRELPAGDIKDGAADAHVSAALVAVVATLPHFCRHGLLFTGLQFGHTGDQTREIAELEARSKRHPWMLHHLTTGEKRLALGEMFRVLRPGGELHLADWGPPETRLMRVAALSLTVLEPQYGTLANLQGRLPDLCAAAGFRDVMQTGRLSTIYGTVIGLSAGRL
jgi:SAM-dependent methyltransferase